MPSLRMTLKNAVYCLLVSAKNDLKKDGTLFHDPNCAHLLSSSHVLLEAYRYYKPNKCICQSFILIFYKKNLPFFTKNAFFVYFMRLTP